MMPDTNACPDPFSLPMNNLADAQALVRAIEALLSQRGLSLRPPPPVPDTCNSLIERAPKPRSGPQ
jgi:hypothetical protein